MRVWQGSLSMLLAAMVALSPAAGAQRISRMDRDLADTILQNVSSDVQKHYFDAKLNGLDWDELVRDTKRKVDNAPSWTVASAEIAALLGRLDDSHTMFLPPGNTITYEYGWKYRIIGNWGFVTEVDPGSDAEHKGMRPGDELLTINSIPADRAGDAGLRYTIEIFLPQEKLHVVLRDPAGRILRLTVDAKAVKNRVAIGLDERTVVVHAMKNMREELWNKERAEYKDFGPKLMILRIPAFVEVGPDVNDLFRKAHGHQTLIVDLRGTPGGLLSSLLSYLNNIFGHEVKIGEQVERKKGQQKITPLTVKGRSREEFGGDVIVLVDSLTASAGEIFARTVQLQQRGTVIGDRTMGRTMLAKEFFHSYGENPVYYYGAEVTAADLIMPDGKRIEHMGVTPDRILLPTAADLAAGRDPVLSYAAGLAGVTLSPEDADKLFPKETFKLDLNF
jgi:C-terminal processing protease CtpA/Prc